MRLNKVQNQFKDIILGSHNAVDQNNDLNDQFVSDAISVQSRLHYYRDSVLGKLINVLAISYPTVKKLIGDDCFTSAARLYVRQNSPRSGNLNLYGAKFPQFIGNLNETQSLPYIHDVAIYDWIFNAAYYANDDTALTHDDLKTQAPATVGSKKFPLRSSVHTIQSNHPLSVIREFCTKDENNKTLDLDQGGEILLVYRPHLSVNVIAITSSEHTMIEALKAELSVSDALEKTLCDAPDFDFQKFLSRFLYLEIFCAQLPSQ